MGFTWLFYILPTHKIRGQWPTFLPIPHLTTLTSKSCLKTPYFEFGFRFIFLGCYFVGLFGVCLTFVYTLTLFIWQCKFIFVCYILYTLY